MSTYEVEMMRGLVKDVSPLPRLRQNPEKAVTASYIENYRFNKSLAGNLCCICNCYEQFNFLCKVL